MTAIAAADAYRLWANTYDLDPNPLVALEHRVLNEYLDLMPGERLLDLAAGTGRWLERALSRKVPAIGLDLCQEMLAIAAKKQGVTGRLACGDICTLPFVYDAADVAVCSFALGYVERLDLAFREMARVARFIITSDLHPDAIRSGWVRSFHAANEKYEIEHYDHSWQRIETSARQAGLRLVWKVEASFGEQERVLFERAGRGNAFDAAQRIPAILASAWTRE